MATSLVRWVIGVVGGLLLLPLALAAQPMNTATPYGTMVEQAVHTLGGRTVACSGLADPGTPPSAQLLCARVPASMFGYFKMGVHGRLYEYLSRGTLHVAHAWASSGNVLEVTYDVKGGTLSVERKRVNGALYAVFEFQSNSTVASASGSSQAASSQASAAHAPATHDPATPAAATRASTATGHP